MFDNFLGYLSVVPPKALRLFNMLRRFREGPRIDGEADLEQAKAEALEEAEVLIEGAEAVLAHRLFQLLGGNDGV